MKNSSYTIGKETHDLPACRAVSQPPAPPRAPHYEEARQKTPEQRLALLRVERSLLQISVCRPTEVSEEFCVSLSPSRQMQG